MSNFQNQKLSFCVGVYNEEQNLTRMINRIDVGLTKIIGPDQFEIIIVDNGSTDGTLSVLNRLNYSRLKVFALPEKGLGRALRLAMEKASYERIVLSAIDLPFGFSDLTTAISIWDSFDLIFGSKAHRLSKVKRSLKRKIFSGVRRFFLKRLFGLKISDSQGSVFLKKPAVRQILPYCHSPGAFFSSQLAIYGQLFCLRMVEIPVDLAEELRPSRFNLLRDGFIILIDLLKEFFVYREVKRKLEATRKKTDGLKVIINS